MLARTLTSLIMAAAVFLPSEGGGAPPAAEPSFQRVLASIDAYFGKLRSLEARFTQRVEVPALEKSEDFHGYLYFQKPEFLRLEYIEPKGQLLVADGRWYWFFMPQPDVLQAMRVPVDEDEGTAAPRYILGGNMYDRFTGSLLGQEEKSGRLCYVLELFPLKSNRYYRSLKAWLDAATYATRAVSYQDVGGTLNSFEFFEITENISIEPQKFIFIPPPGTQILDEY